jgi:hypothetical protein
MARIGLVLHGCATGVRRHRHPLGHGRTERYLAPASALHRMQSQGRDASTTELGRGGYRLYAVSGRSYSDLLLRQLLVNTTGFPHTVITRGQ